MNAFNQALHAFWSGVTAGGVALPAYQSGLVPDGAAFPYIVYTVTRGSAFTLSFLTAIVYVKVVAGESVAEKRAALLDAMAAKIPECGVKLPFSGGMALLNRNGADFLTAHVADDYSVTGVAAGRLSYQVNFY